MVRADAVDLGLFWRTNDDCVVQVGNVNVSVYRHVRFAVRAGVPFFDEVNVRPRGCVASGACLSQRDFGDHFGVVRRFRFFFL